MITGTISSAVKLHFLDTKWQQKKDELNTKKQEDLTPEERMLEDYKEQMEEQRESNSHADLYNKLKSGGRLTAEDLAYLEKNDPEALRRYKENKAEQKAYERDLKNCKTKDDVSRVKMNKLGNFASQANTIANDPYIPLDKKLILMNQLNDKVCRIGESHLKFVKSLKYKDMPTDEEIVKENIEESLEENTSVEDNEVITEFDDVEESSEEKLKKAQREEYQKNNEDDSSSVSLDFEKVKGEIATFNISKGESESTFEVTV